MLKFTLYSSKLSKLLLLGILQLCFLSNLSFAQAPSSILPDLQYFKLTFPIDDNGNDYTGVSYGDRDDPLIKADEVDNLSGWTPSGDYDDYFFVSGNEVVFKAHCAGALTSANSYPRCELREKVNGGDDLWQFSGEHELNTTFRITNVPNQKQEVCVLQIKGNTSNSTSGTDEVLRVEYRQDGSSGLHLEVNESSGPTDIMDYTLGQTIEARMYVNNGNVTLELDNLNVSGSRGEYTLSYSTSYSHGYFKAGAYTQSSIWSQKNGVGNESPSAYGEVRFSALDWGVGGGGGGGGSSCDNTAVPGNRHVDNIGTTSATLDWNAVANNDHYNVRWRKTGTSSWSYKTSIRNTTQHTITGLSSNTTYEWQMRSKCDDNTGAAYSAGPGPNFTTSGSGGGGLPSPWQTTNIGNVSATGGASYSSSTFSVQGSGADIWNSSDEFRFVYQSMSGDGEVIAKLNSLTNTNSWAKAGVMIRESLSAGSKHAMTIARPGSNGVSFQRRTSTNGGSSHSSKGNVALAEWVRIVRSGNSFTSYHSNNGTSWTQIGGAVNISMSSTVYVGLCVTSHNDGTLTTASFNNVSVNGGSTVPTGNLALNKSTSQYNTAHGGVSSRAVDGNTSGNWNNGSVTHTTSTSAAWWEVDLGASYPIGDIVVWNRTNCCTNRLRNFTVRVENGSGNSVWSQTVTSTPSPSTSVNAGGVSGRYIRIEQNVTEPLSLAEVQVYASSGSRMGIVETPIKVYPNPATSAILIDGLEEGEEVAIFNTLGSLVMKSTVRKVNISTLAKGIYVVRVKGRKPVKFVKE